MHAPCAVLVLIQPVVASSGEPQESGAQPSQSQAEDATRPAEEIAIHWETVGESLLAGDSDCILDYLDQIIEEDPEAWEAYALRARVRDETGDPIGAERDRTMLAGVGGAYTAVENRRSRAIDRNPTDPDPVWQRAVHRWQAGNDVEGALTDLDLVVELNDGIAPQKVHMMRAKLLEVQGDYEGAILDYSTVIEMESGQGATALTERARLFGLVGRPAEAERDLEILAARDKTRRDHLIMTTSKNLEVDPGNIGSLYRRGMEYLRRDDLAAAFDDAETIISLDPDNWVGYSLRSGVRLRTGDIRGYREDRAMVKELTGKQD